MARTVILPELIEERIYHIRGHRVMLDEDLAQLYSVATRDLNKAVTRNLYRFPPDFMFKLTKAEFKNLKFQFGTSSWGGRRKLPRVFSEHGVLMLSSVLKSKKAAKVNIEIMRTFVKLRNMLNSHKDLCKKVEDLEKKYDVQFKVVFKAIKELMSPPAKKSKPQIGFRPM